MAKIAITCYKCKEEFITEPYFCNTDLYTREDAKNGNRYHIARTVAMAICPHCGEVVYSNHCDMCGNDNNLYD